MYLLSFSMYGFISNGGNFCKYVLAYIIDSFLLAYLLTIQGPCKHGCHGYLAPVDFELSSFSIIFPVPGFLIKPINGQKGCEVGYVTHTNPRGKIPTWLTNKVTSYVAPRMLRKLHKACIQVNNLQKVPFVHNFIKQN